MTRILCAALCLLTLAGCEGLPSFGGSAPATSGPTTEPVDSAAVPAKPDAPKSTDQNKQASASPVNDDPAQFVGQAESLVDSTLGAPDLIRREGAIEVHQFHGADCVLDLYLYPQETGKGLSVRHAELRGPGLDEPARRACLANLIRSRRLTS